jgi:hypothetical protein
LVKTAFRCCPPLFRVSPPEICFPLFVRLCDTIFAFTSIKTLSRCIVFLSDAFSALAASGQPPELRDVAERAFIALISHASGLRERAQTRSQHLLDNREDDNVYNNLDRVMALFLSAILQHYKDSATAWREHVPMTPSPLPLRVWATFFRCVEQIDDVLAYLISCIKNSNEPTMAALLLGHVVLEEIAAIAANRVPIAGDGVTAIVGELARLIEGLPRGSNLRARAAIVLAVIMFGYEIEGGEALAAIVAATGLLKVPDGVAEVVVAEALVWVMRRYWEVVVSVDGAVMIVGCIVNVGERTGRAIAREYFGGVEWREVCGRVELPRQLLMRIEETVSGQEGDQICV